MLYLLFLRRNSAGGAALDILALEVVEGGLVLAGQHLLLVVLLEHLVDRLLVGGDAALWHITACRLVATCALDLRPARVLLLLLLQW